MPGCNATVCALDVVSPDEADVDHRCGHAVVVSLRARAIMGRGVVGCMSIAMFGHDVPPDQTDVNKWLQRCINTLFETCANSRANITPKACWGKGVVVIKNGSIHG